MADTDRRSDAAAILGCLHRVAEQRSRRLRETGLAERVAQIKAFQHARFIRTYADLLASDRYGAAARFFLEDLYGPADFTRRDSEFARTVPGMARLFSREIVATVHSLAELHALSEELDTAMAEAWPGGTLDADAYARAWRAVDQAPSRARQITLMVAVGSALDRYTRSRILRQSLRLMRGAAQIAGLGALQAFLERGFDTFRDMHGADEFLSVIADRERTYAESLFGSSAQSPAV